MGAGAFAASWTRPVPKTLIREILELAMRAPTSPNTQPWNFYVVWCSFEDAGQPATKKMSDVISWSPHPDPFNVVRRSIYPGRFAPPAMTVTMESLTGRVVVE